MHAKASIDLIRVVYMRCTLTAPLIDILSIAQSVCLSLFSSHTIRRAIESTARSLASVNSASNLHGALYLYVVSHRARGVRLSPDRDHRATRTSKLIATSSYDVFVALKRHTWTDAALYVLF